MLSAIIEKRFYETRFEKTRRQLSTLNETRTGLVVTGAHKAERHFHFLELLAAIAKEKVKQLFWLHHILQIDARVRRMARSAERKILNVPAPARRVRFFRHTLHCA